MTGKLELIKAKIVAGESLKSLISYWRFKDQKIVFTNGCFDIIHRGHVEYLAKASGLGNILIVGLNSDKSVKRIKGENRPLQDEESRALILASFQFVSCVVLFDQDTPYEIIDFIRPDILVKGADYKPEEIVGADIIKANGGQVITIDFVEGFSTSNIIKRL